MTPTYSLHPHRTQPTYSLLKEAGLFGAIGKGLSAIRNIHGTGLIGKTLVGGGEKALEGVSRVVHPSGRIIEDAIESKVVPYRHMLKTRSLEGFGNRTKKLLIGKAPFRVTKQRFLQGGVLGKGGLLRSSLAAPEKLKADIASKGLLKGVMNNKLKTLGYGFGTSFVAGVPAVSVGSDVYHGNFSEIPKDLAKGMVWPIIEPFSFLSQLSLAPAGDELASRAVDAAGNGIKHVAKSTLNSITGGVGKTITSLKPSTLAQHSFKQAPMAVKNISPYSFT